MTAVIMRRVELPIVPNVGLVPVDDQARELLLAIRKNRDVSVDLTTPRNPRHHRLYFQLVNFIGEHCDLFFGAPREDIHLSLKVAAGLVDTKIDLGSRRIITVPRSIAWASMDQTAFRTFFDDATRVVANRWMPAGTTPESVRAELLSMVDGNFMVGSRVY